VNVELDQRRIAERLEAVDLPRLDNKNIAGAAFEGVAVDRPYAAAFADELDFVVRMPVRPGPEPGLP
jgi:hypothetical protein